MAPAFGVCSAEMYYRNWGTALPLASRAPLQSAQHVGSCLAARVQCLHVSSCVHCARAVKRLPACWPLCNGCGWLEDGVVVLLLLGKVSTARTIRCVCAL
jgi:hypothetical protein